MIFRYLYTNLLLLGRAISLVFLLACVAHGDDTFSLRHLKMGDNLPPIKGKSVLGNDTISYTSETDRPAILIFFSLTPNYRQKRSIDIVMQMHGLIKGKYAGKVDLVSVFSDDEEMDTLKKLMGDGLISPPVIDDSRNELYDKFGIFMTPIVIISTQQRQLHAVIPAAHNIKEMVDNNLKLLLGEWSELEFKESLKPTYTKTWSPEEKEFLRRINYGRIMFERKMYSSALREYSTASKILPNRLEGHIGLGMVYYSMEKYDKAEGEYMQALSYQPENDEALAGLGLTLLKKGKIEQATAILENAIITENPKLEVIVALAEIYETKGDVVKAMRLNKMAIEKLIKRFE